MTGTADQRPGRIAALDIARTVALIGMAIYHFTYDLEMFGHLAPGTAVTGFWAIFARLVAGSFLFLAGISLWLAHGRAIRWRAFARRFAMIAGAALLVTLATRLALPESFVFFGILHSIAAASLIGLAFLRLPAGLTLAAAAGILAIARLPHNPAFDAPPSSGRSVSRPMRAPPSTTCRSSPGSPPSSRALRSPNWVQDTGSGPTSRITANLAPSPGLVATALRSTSSTSRY